MIERLEAERPMASALELDLIKQRVRERVARNERRPRRTGALRSRVAILATLVAGMVLSTGGAGLAVSGFATQKDNAAASQYGTGITGGPSGGGPSGGAPSGGGVLGEQESGGSAGTGGSSASPSSAAQPARQVESGAQGGGGQLPFTGFAAIPILLGGVALLAAGLVMRRRTADET